VKYGQVFQVVYRQQGIEFLTKLKEQQWPPGSPSEYLNEMENIGSGFIQWAHTYHLQNDGDN